LFGNCFGYFSKNWAIFSKSSGHPDPFKPQNILQIVNIGNLLHNHQTDSDKSIIKGANTCQILITFIWMIFAGIPGCLKEK
jgi:hypothetical protein